MRDYQTEMTVLVTPEMTNFGGNMHGGELLKLLDQVAYTCAMRYCGNYVVTLAVNNVLFKESIGIGELIHFKAAVNYTGNTSLVVGIRVTSENLETTEIRHTNTCYFTMVSVDADRKPAPVPTLTPATADEKRRWDEAVRRRAAQIK